MIELGDAMDAAPVPVLVSNEDGYYVYQNEAAQCFLGYERSELIGKHLTDLIAYDPQMIERTFAQLKRQGNLSGRARYCHADGSLREADVNIFGQTLDDQTRVFVSLIHPLARAGAASVEPQISLDLCLTGTELRLLFLLSDGFSDAEVARLLGTSEDSIGREVRVLLTKMNASSRTEAAVLAIKKRVLL